MRQCFGKVRHKSKQDATTHVLHRKKYAVLNAYRCQFCGFWHVGEQSPSYSLADYKRRREELAEELVNETV